MEEILHQVVDSLSKFIPLLAGFYTCQVVSRISSINSSTLESCSSENDPEPKLRHLDLTN